MVNKLIVPRIKYKLNCLNCGNKFDIETTESNFKKGKYKKCCSSECSHSYSSKHNNYDLTKKSFCKKCGNDIIIKNQASIKNSLCNDCKKINGKYNKNKYIVKEIIKCEKVEKDKIKYRIFCKQCGQEKCLKPEICKKFRIYPTLIKYFGFDKKYIGTLKIYEEYERIKLNLYNDYYIDLLSIPDLMIKYDYVCKNDRNFSKIMESLNVKRRKFSDSTKNSYLVGKLNPLTHTPYKNGWHTTWDEKEVFYRSSYELNYCKILDNQKIDYEMEKIRLIYWDSQKLKFRVAIPDFYLKYCNTLVEIKSDYTYDEQNMKDKIKSYKEHGYNFKLILEGKEINI